MKTYCRIIFLASVLAFARCSLAAQTNSPTNDTERLDDMAQNEPQSADFVARVKLYYQSIEKKDWPTSYDMRAADFKHDVARDLYLKTMADSKENLISYKVLDVGLYSNEKGTNTAAELIMEFHEGEVVLYGCARWIKQGGIWVCDESGLKKSLLKSQRMPDWIPN
jgi:hypothetical protein